MIEETTHAVFFPNNIFPPQNTKCHNVTNNYFIFFQNQSVQQHKHLQHFFIKRCVTLINKPEQSSVSFVNTASNLLPLLLQSVVLHTSQLKTAFILTNELIPSKSCCFYSLQSVHTIMFTRPVFNFVFQLKIWI